LVNTESSSSMTVPFNQWVHFEMFLRKAQDKTGEISIWQDGEQIISVQGVETVQKNDWMQWNVGASTANIDPTPALLYIDDAVISLSRVGPGASPASN
jgi:hypothetical protein